jgi:hypothetical protein
VNVGVVISAAFPDEPKAKIHKSSRRPNSMRVRRRYSPLAASPFNPTASDVGRVFAYAAFGFSRTRSGMTVIGSPFHCRRRST